MEWDEATRAAGGATPKPFASPDPADQPVPAERQEG
jgi:hypothetical protein